MGVPLNVRLIRETPFKIADLGVPTFMETPVFSVDMLILFLHETGWQGANFIAFPLGFGVTRCAREQHWTQESARTGQSYEGAFLWGNYLLVI